MPKFTAIFALFIALSLNAATPKGCYEIYKINHPQEIETAVFVLIDETTPFNEKLRGQILSNALSFIKGGNYLFVGKFSALINDKYNEPLFNFALDTELGQSEQNSINKNTLNKIKKCQKDQAIFVRKSVQNAIAGAFLKEEIAKSDIFYALKDFAKSQIAQVKANRKIVILASDMLENSAITSFYAKNSVREINPQKEQEIIEKNDIFADFDGAEIFVIGAGVTQNKKSYVNSKMLNALNKFWSGYFERSNATLAEFGAPALKRAVE